jgi:prepilin-type N-terminal cleavage/methylation domain-containing protein
MIDSLGQTMSRGGGRGNAAGGAAFTLIEVLIAVLILALGLLGIGAVFPAVIRAQRTATDATLAVTCAEEAKNIILTRPDMNAPQGGTGANPGVGGWWFWLGNRTGWSPATGTVGYSWQMWNTGGRTELDPLVGTFTFDRGDPLSNTVLTGDQRIWPLRSAGGGAPRFVWDFIGRRVRRASSSDPERIQIALFVRPIDSQIRLARTTSNDYTLRRMLNSPPVGRVPQPGLFSIAVGVDPLTGRPTLNGSGNGTNVYAAPLKMEFRILQAGNNYDRTRIEPVAGSGVGSNAGPADYLRFISQPGQKIVDNLGNIYTVLSSDAGTNPLRLRIDPPFPTYLDASLRYEAAFTPQIPVTVSVFTITPTP